MDGLVFREFNFLPDAFLRSLIIEEGRVTWGDRCSIAYLYSSLIPVRSTYCFLGEDL